jgi:TolA-binding protein
VENYTDSLESLWSQAALVWYYVRAGDSENADTEYAEMLEIYANQKTLPKEVFQIGDIYLEVDNSEKARALYQQVLDEWPESQYVFNAKAGFIKADIHDGYDDKAMTGIDTLITDYKDRVGLSNTVFLFGEQYWNLALNEHRKLPSGRLAIRKESDIEKMVDYYSKALTVWEKVINQLPSALNVSTAYKMAAEASKSSRQYEKALQYFQAYVEKWPDDDYAGHCQFMACCVCQSMLGKGNIPENESYELLKQNYEKFIKDYPENPQHKTVYAYIKDYEIRHTPEKVPQTLEEALEMCLAYDNAEKQGGGK